MNIDDTLENADWIKQLRWDLPTTEQGMIFLFGADWLDKISKLPAWSMAPESLKTVAKHGDPSRPNYAALHPDSPAVAGGGWTKRTVTRQDVYDQVFQETGNKVFSRHVSGLGGVITDEDGKKISADEQDIDWSRDQSENVRLNKSGAAIHQVGDEVWSRTLADGLHLEVAFGTDAKDISEQQRKELMEDVDWLQSNFPARPRGGRGKGSMSIRVSSDAFTGGGYKNAGGWAMLGSDRGAGMLALNPSEFIGNYETGGGYRRALVHEWGHTIDLRSTIGETVPSHELWGSNDSDMSKYGKTNTWEGWAEAFRDHVVSGGKSDKRSTRWFVQEFGWKTDFAPMPNHSGIGSPPKRTTTSKSVSVISLSAGVLKHGTPGERGYAQKHPTGGTQREGFRTATTTDRERILRDHGYKVPEHWVDVLVPEGESHLVVKGQDAKREWHHVYNQEWKEQQAASKFKRTKELHKKTPQLDAALAKDLPKGSEDAMVVAIMRNTGCRVGQESAVQGRLVRDATYGASTLRAKHVKTTPTGSVILDFVGKDKVKQHYVIKDPVLAKAIEKQKKGKSGNDKMFPNSTDSTSVAYLRRVTGLPKVKNHDLRTHKANAVAILLTKGKRRPATFKDYKKRRFAVGDAVAKQLGNTRAVALSTYINPVVFEPWMRPEWIGKK